MEELLEKAGDQHDPERLVIEWSAVLQQPLVSTARIAVVFTTEKPLQVRELQWFEYPVASIDLIVEGAKQRWVDNTFTELDPFFPSVRLGGIYRPLWVFRNKAVVHSMIDHVQLVRKVRKTGETWPSQIALRYIGVEELNRRLAEHGFTVVAQYGDWAKTPYGLSSPEIITVCRREELRGTASQA